MNNDELIPLVIAAAAAGAGDPTRPGWASDVTTRIPHVAALMGEGSRAWKAASAMLDAHIFAARYLGHQLEESSRRLVVQLGTTPSKRYPDGVEPIRSHRTDNAQGKAMQKMLSGLKEGDEILVWKAMESNDDRGEKYRVLAHFQFLRRPKEGEAEVRRVPDDVPAPQPRRPAEPAGDTDGASVAARAFNELASKDKAAVARRARDEGITVPNPGDASERLLAIIGEVTGT